MHHRIYTPQLGTAGEVTIGGDEFHHAARVVRVREGEQVELFDGRGHAAAGRIDSVGKDELRVIIERGIPSREMRHAMTLAVAVIQLEKFELVLQKATELGAARIIPLITDRIEIREERFRGKRDRWARIIFEAVKQSGRAVLPDLADPAAFDQVLREDALRVVFDGDTEPSAGPLPKTAMTLMIGPEGGWSERELDAARAAGCLFARLGARRLRAETAAMVALAATAARLGELE